MTETEYERGYREAIERAWRVCRTQRDSHMADARNEATPNELRETHIDKARAVDICMDAVRALDGSRA